MSGFRATRHGEGMYDGKIRLANDPRRGLAALLARAWTLRGPVAAAVAGLVDLGPPAPRAVGAAAGGRPRATGAAAGTRREPRAGRTAAGPGIGADPDRPGDRPRPGGPVDARTERDRELEVRTLEPTDFRFPINLATALRLSDARPLIVAAAQASVWVAEAELTRPRSSGSPRS